MKPRFRNGMRVVLAERQPSGDWLVQEWQGQEPWLERDEEFRAQWEPWSDEARRVFARGAGEELEGVELEGVSRN